MEESETMQQRGPANGHWPTGFSHEGLVTLARLVLIGWRLEGLGH